MNTNTSPFATAGQAPNNPSPEPLRHQVMKALSDLTSSSNFLYAHDESVLAARINILKGALEQSIIGNDAEAKKLLDAANKDSVKIIGFDLDVDEAPNEENQKNQDRCCGARRHVNFNFNAVPAYSEQCLMLAITSAAHALCSTNMVHRITKESTKDRNSNSKTTEFLLEFPVTTNDAGEVQNGVLVFQEASGILSRMLGKPVLADIQYKTIDGRVLKLYDLIQNKKLFIAVLIHAVADLSKAMGTSNRDVNMVSKSVLLKRGNYKNCFEYLSGDVLGYARSISVESTGKKIMDSIPQSVIRTVCNSSDFFDNLTLIHKE